MNSTRTMITDAGLPGLAELLDPDRLTARIEAAGARLVGRTHLRYKPGTSCVAGIALDDGDAFGYVVSDEARSKLDKIIRKTDPEAVLVHDRKLNLIIVRARADRDLPALADPQSALATIRPGPPAVLRTLAYKPQRRWVGLARRPGAAPLLLRAYRPSTVADAHRRLTWYEQLTGTRRLVGWQANSGLIATTFQPGTSLAELITRSPAGSTNGSPESTSHGRPPDLLLHPDDDPIHPAAADALHDCGVALARLHDHPPIPGPTVRQADPAATVALIATILPGQAAQARRILNRLNATEPAQAPLRPCHGDFSADQVIITPNTDLSEMSCPVGQLSSDNSAQGDGAAPTHGPHPTELSEVSCPGRQLGSDKSAVRVSLIDFDRSGLGDPAADLAGLPAAGLGGAAFDLVLAGYRAVRPIPAGLDWQLARALLLRAAEPFRTGDVDWPETIAARLTLIEEALP